MSTDGKRPSEMPCQHLTTTTVDQDGRAWFACWECDALLHDIGPEGSIYEEATDDLT